MTDQHCTNCGKEFEPFEDVVIIGVGTIAREVVGYYAELSEGPYTQTLCEECADKMLHPKPNRVVIETTGAVLDVRAERPDEVVIIVQNPGGPMMFPRQEVYGVEGRPIKQLNCVKGT